MDSYYFSFKQLQTHCGAAFTAQWKCLESNNHLYQRCRTTQDVMDQCVFEKMVNVLLGLFVIFQGLKGHFKTFDTKASGSSYKD